MVPHAAELDVVAGCELVAEVAQTQGEVQLQVLGGSMLPSIWPGDRLIVQRRNPNQIQPGKIVLYKREGGLVAHRVVARDGESLLTRGDSVSKADAPVQAEEIVGEIVAIIRRGQRVALELTLGRRMVAWVLRRSNFSTRALLHFGRMAWAR
ncbi:MAG: signal peptidase I [Candidatus Acidiferrales bacterium]|jgi:signal peptidase I